MNFFSLSTPVKLTIGFLSLYIFGSLLIFGYLNYQLSATLTLQIDRALKDQQTLMLLKQHDSGYRGMVQAVDNEISSKGKEDRAYRVVDAKGKTLFEIGGLFLPEMKPFKGIKEITLGGLGNEKDKTDARVIAFPLSDKLNMFVAIGTRQLQQLKQELWLTFVKTEILIVLLGAAVGFWLTQRFHGRIESFNQLAKQIVKSGDLSSRMPVAGNDEFASLAINVNAMLERIDRLVQGIRQVSDNIAHDLRTPLTRLRADVEVALRQQDPEIDHATLERVLEELENMQTIFNSLLSLGQAEAGGMRIKRKEVDITAFLGEMVELYAPSAEEHGLELKSEIASDIHLRVDRQLIAQALSNLFDNALKYVPEGGTLQLRASQKDNIVEIVLEDNGPGIPPEMREKIFERFSRIDPSRTLSGSGLGLALVRAFIELHNGSVDVYESPLGGAAFRIILPT
ncbi:sensor histidine kinase [Sulfurirhabdus autotrophica]|uniref:histidine kinase n=1 Tax=Sulfurirhabdus autotrophica TaxID=1706046 RepID=A0A4R3YF28_9PROT|nr:ATP-binding protein [Sulfurirhabdus autotrophica]TCV90700.1 signal transduction histidine kinase [Sulfurirhabdus autotrophica]